jgi:capsid protein
MNATARTRLVNVRLKGEVLDRSARVPSVRRFEGAAGGRRLASAGSMANLAEAILAARGRLSGRARYLVANNALASAGAQAWVSGLIGSGIVAQSQHPDRAVREGINARHAAWVNRADADGLRDLYQLQAAMAHSLVVNGEAFAALVTDPDTGELRIKLLDPEQIDSFFDRDLDGGNRIVSGIELDRYGRRVAYHILRDTFRFRARSRSGFRNRSHLPRRCSGAGARRVVVRGLHLEAVRARQGVRRPGDALADQRDAHGRHD